MIRTKVNHIDILHSTFHIRLNIYVSEKFTRKKPSLEKHRHRMYEKYQEDPTINLSVCLSPRHFWLICEHYFIMLNPVPLVVIGVLLFLVLLYFCGCVCDLKKKFRCKDKGRVAVNRTAHSLTNSLRECIGAERA